MEIVSLAFCLSFVISMSIFVSAVMSQDNLRLIGVAGVDIQTSGLPAILKNQIEQSLQSRRSDIPSNREGVTFGNCIAVSFMEIQKFELFL